MARFAVLALVIFCVASTCAAQGGIDLDLLNAADAAFRGKAGTDGQRSAFLDVLLDDSVIFAPSRVKGREFWDAQTAAPAVTHRRATAFADISSNGLLGYTTGGWKTTQKDKKGDISTFGEYVTVWERRGGAGFKIALDMTTKHDEIPAALATQSVKKTFPPDINKRGWSATNDAMGFLRASMQAGGLAAAFEAGAMDDVRLLVDGEPAITGKKNVVKIAKRYLSMRFPADLAIFQSGDMAYFWNSCSYANSIEGAEQGNCLQIMKLRNKKWWIVLAAFARIEDERPPTLITPTKPRT
jgi:ketosteroid isomerase-like protein